jgi:hypothetical protein
VPTAEICSIKRYEKELNAAAFLMINTPDIQGG